MMMIIQRQSWTCARRGTGLVSKWCQSAYKIPEKLQMGILGDNCSTVTWKTATTANTLDLSTRASWTMLLQGIVPCKGVTVCGSVLKDENKNNPRRQYVPYVSSYRYCSWARRQYGRHPILWEPTNTMPCKTRDIFSTIATAVCCRQADASHTCFFVALINAKAIV